MKSIKFRFPVYYNGAETQEVDLSDSGWAYQKSLETVVLLSLNTAESCTRMAMDAMKWSNVKYEAIKAICDNDEQQSSHELLKYSGSTCDKLLNFAIVSGGFDAGSQSSITIGNVEYSKKRNGINIVVYSEETRKVIDSSVYDGTLHR